MSLIRKFQLFLSMARPKEFGVLRENDEKWIASLGKPLSNTDRVRLFRLRLRVIKALGDLAFLAQVLPEDQQNKMFSWEPLQRLVHNLVGKDLKHKDRSRSHYQLAYLFAQYGLNVCQDKVIERNPDTFSTVVQSFNDVREMIFRAVGEVLSYKERISSIHELKTVKRS